jgi:hypothetical protein
MTRTVEVTRAASAAPDQVWRVLGELDGWADWLPTVTRIEREPVDRAAAGARTPDAAGPAVASVYRIEQPKLPPTRWTVTDWRPGTSFTWRSRRPGVVSTADHVVRPLAGGGSEITLRMSFAGPLSWLVHRLYAGLTRDYMETEATALAERAAGRTAG